MISDSQKQIYNSFLYTSRKVKNQPCKFRQNFDSIDPTTELTLKKLDSFFTNYHNIKYSDFFLAPYEIYNNDEYFNLQFYTTRRAIKCYSNYIKQKETSDPDHESTIDDCKQACSFIYKFCKENKLTLHQYKNLINGTTPIVLQHLRDHKINFYILQGLEIHSLIQSTEPQIINFIVDDFFNIYNTTKSNFIRSTKLKIVIRSAFKIIEDRILQFS